MTLYRDEAVVLRTHKLAEADRIVTLLTRSHGRVRAVAKGVRRTKSKFGARLEPAVRTDLQLYAGRELDIVTQAETLDAFGPRLSADYPGYTAAMAVLETAERLTAEEREPSLRLYLLVVGALRALADRTHPSRLVLDAFVLRSLAAAGYEAALEACARCGTPGPHRGFHPAAGGLVCGDCRPPGTTSPDPAVIALLLALRDGDWPLAEGTPEALRRQGSGLVAAFGQFHLERNLRSLPFVESGT